MGTTYKRFDTTTWALFEDLLKTRLSGIKGELEELQTKVLKTPAAGTADSLATARTIDGVSFDGSSSVSHYGICNTAGSETIKVVACSGFSLVNGAEITVRFDVANTATDPLYLNVNDTGAKLIKYHGVSVSGSETLLEDYTYQFRYNGSWFEVVGSLGKVYDDFIGAQSAVNGEQGLVPAPSAGDQGKYLQANGTWSVPANTTYADFVAATAQSAGTAGLVPAPAIGDDTTKFLRADGSWAAPLDSDTTYTDFTGATSEDDGTNGLVPAPDSADREKFLRADGTWAMPPDTIYVPFVAATAQAAGANGLVPAPAIGDDATKFLNATGAWVVPPLATQSSSGYMSANDKLGLDTLYHQTNHDYSVGEQVRVLGQPNYLLLECTQAGRTAAVAPDFSEDGFDYYESNHAYNVGDQVRVEGQPDYLVLECITAGTSGSTPPDFSATEPSS